MELSETRKRIDAVDREMLALFIERMELSAAAAEYKSLLGLPTRDAAREEEILSAAEQNSGELAPYARRFFSCVLSLSRERQEELRAERRLPAEGDKSEKESSSGTGSGDPGARSSS